MLPGSGTRVKCGASYPVSRFQKPVQTRPDRAASPQTTTKKEKEEEKKYVDVVGDLIHDVTPNQKHKDTCVVCTKFEQYHPTEVLGHHNIDSSGPHCQLHRASAASL
jgi:hypothetical protein